MGPRGELNVQTPLGEDGRLESNTLQGDKRG